MRLIYYKKEKGYFVNRFKDSLNFIFTGSVAGTLFVELYIFCPHFEKLKLFNL